MNEEIKTPIDAGNTEDKSASCCSTDAIKAKMRGADERGHEKDHEQEHNHNHQDHSDHHGDHHHDEGSCCSVDHTANQQQIDSIDVPENYVHDTLKIHEMDCPMEEALIRNKLKGHDEIDELYCNFMRRELHVVHNGDIDHIIAKIKELGMNPLNLAVSSGERVAPTSLYDRYETPRLWISGIAAAISEGVHLLGGSSLIAGFFAILSIIFVGPTTYKKGWLAIKNRTLNINALMSVAVTGALILGEFPEAAMVMFLFTLSEVIESKSLHRAQVAVEKLLNLAPDVATVMEAGEPVERAVSAIEIGSIVRVRPGERIALDGLIVKGNTSIDEAPITGESVPVDKSVDDPVYAGSINQFGEFEYRTTTDASHSTLAKIVKTIEEAQSQRAPVERFIDRFAAIYTPAVFIIAILIALLQPLFGVTWFQSIYNALVILIIACPCALVISTPVAIVSSLTRLARHGILVKGGGFLEVASGMKILAFDKTGTITEGKPTLIKQIITGGMAEAEVIPYAMTLASRSDHPVSKALVRDYTGEYLAVDRFEAIPGQGTKAAIQDELVFLGNVRLMQNHGILYDVEIETITELEKEGYTLTLFAKNGRIAAIFMVADKLKKGSKKVMKRLQALGLKTVLISGDNENTVATIAREVGIDKAFGAQLPEDKVTRIRELKAKGVTGMIGDGINDAPALATSDIGFAMGVMGSDVAIETANVALMDDDLDKLPLFFRQSRATMRIIRQNITLALGIKAAFFIALLFGHSSMLAAVFADVGATLLVVGNSLRLLYKKRDQHLNQ